jgi:hypothetical protein
MKPPINTFEDLVASEDVELIILADTMTKKQILVSFFIVIFFLKCYDTDFHLLFYGSNLISGSYTRCTEDPWRWYSRTSWSNIKQHRGSDRSLENWAICLWKCKKIFLYKNHHENLNYKFVRVCGLLFQSQSFSNSFIASQFQENGKCRFKTSDPYSMTMFYSMPLQKDSKYTPIFKYA